MCLCVYMCVCACVCVCMCVCVYVCMYVCMYVHVHVFGWVKENHTRIIFNCSLPIFMMMVVAHCWIVVIIIYQS